jgi:cellulose biosynthesis protein BcsQ
MTQIVAVAGGCGGVGTTRLSVECGATLARAGRDVAIFDAALATQGLRSYVDTQISPDVTALMTENASLGDVLYDVNLDTPGRLVAAPANAPFERLARAQTAGAAQHFERQLAAASLSYDVVLVDTPPVGGNHAVAAVNAAEQVALVTRETPRGRDAESMARGRLNDVGCSVDTLLKNRTKETDSDGVPIPQSKTVHASDAPVCSSPDETFAPAVATAVETILDVSLDLDFPSGRPLGGLRR